MYFLALSFWLDSRATAATIQVTLQSHFTCST
jgi:hypothetical protein